MLDGDWSSDVCSSDLICNLYPKAKNTGTWMKEGWHVAAAYVLGFAALYLALGWHPDALPVK
jgi:hypothetical protein